MPKKDSTNLHKEKRGLDFKANGFQQEGGGRRDAQARPIGDSLYGGGKANRVTGEYASVRTGSSGETYSTAAKSMGVGIPIGFLVVLGVFVLISRST
jgi:hypothetical protein